MQGTQELDYSTYLGYAGLELETHTVESAVQGFSASRNDGGLLQVDSVDEGSDAQRAGLQQGDVVLMADGNLAARRTQSYLAFLAARAGGGDSRLCAAVKPTT